MKKTTLSVIMPALNEENNIEAAVVSTLEAFQNHDITGEIIVVNDGSTDNTRKIVESIIEKESRVRLINHEKPIGVGYSFLDGVKIANNEVVVMFPGDNENDPDNALNFFDLMDKVDIIVPFIHNVEVRERNRRILSSIYRFIINISFGVNLNYTNGTIFYRKILLEGLKVKSTGFFYNAELIIKLVRKGYLFAEVPNFLKVRGSGTSKALTFKSLIEVMKAYLSLFYMIHIKKIESKKDYNKLNKASVTYIRKQNFEGKAQKEVVNV